MGDSLWVIVCEDQAIFFGGGEGEVICLCYSLLIYYYCFLFSLFIFLSFLVDPYI